MENEKYIYMEQEARQASNKRFICLLCNPFYIFVALCANILCVCVFVNRVYFDGKGLANLFIDILFELVNKWSNMSS